LPLFIEKYSTLKTKVSALKLMSGEYAEFVSDICLYSLGILKRECVKVDLISQVPGKEYYAFRKTTTTGNRETIRTSRPINKALFIEDESHPR
jgi:hypothetical protein